MREIGVSVAKGILSTLVGIMPLCLGTSEVFRVFFKMFLCILIVGGSHGLVFLPVILSFIGPSAPAFYSAIFEVDEHGHVESSKLPVPGKHGRAEAWTEDKYSPSDS